MTRPLLSAALLILIMAQGAVRGQEVSPPPPAPDYTPNLWKEFRSPESGFSIRFPGAPTGSTELSPDNIILHALIYGSSKFIFYGVTYRDLPKAVTGEAEARKFLLGIRETRLLGMEGKMKLLSENETTRDGAPALQLDIELLPNRRLRELNVIRGRRHYNVMVITFNNHQAMASENGYAQIANSFLGSFHLTGYELRVTSRIPIAQGVPDEPFAGWCVDLSWAI